MNMMNFNEMFNLKEVTEYVNEFSEEVAKHFELVAYDNDYLVECCMREIWANVEDFSKCTDETLLYIVANDIPNSGNATFEYEKRFN